MTLEDILRVASLADYNTRLVVISTTLLGLACGLIGSFLMLRKRSLMGDALSHATLPGIVLSFMLATAAGLNAKSLPLLLLGAWIAGVAGYLTVLAIRGMTRLKDDAAMGIVLSVFFGAGIAMMSMAQDMGGSSAGLQSFIYGKTASMVRDDFLLLAGITLVVAIVSVLLFKEFKLVCFDEAYAHSIGLPVQWLDILMLGLAATIIVAGLQAVGLILIIAYLITPAAAARFWTHRVEHMAVYSALIGALSGWLGSSVSALYPRLPAGAIIVLVGAGFFLLSMLFGTARGVIPRLLRQHQLRLKIRHQHLLRAAYELLEARGDIAATAPVSLDELQARRTWTPRSFSRTLNAAHERALIERIDRSTIHLTDAGLAEATKVTRNHRLWEIYLIEHADIATTHFERVADAVELVLGESMVRNLEQHLLIFRCVSDDKPASPHPFSNP